MKKIPKIIFVFQKTDFFGIYEIRSTDIINLNSVGNAPASRAYEQGGGLYDDGETLENKINKVRFYFYNADGTAYKLQNTGTNGGDQNWIEQEVTTETGNHSVTVSGKTQAVLVSMSVRSVKQAFILSIRSAVRSILQQRQSWHSPVISRLPRQHSIFPERAQQFL